ncbi:hypothetical protein [Kitasatospora griseola]|uniref:hypothetical protein n=1 Tax=Kitasatospora griseola TaxID=2064 RepID=UPI003807B871
MTAPAVEEPWAAQRDASWYSRPDVRTVKALHVAGREGREGFYSRCGRSVLNDNECWDLAEVPPGLRCRSNGCRQAWPVEVTEASR